MVCSHCKNEMTLISGKYGSFYKCGFNDKHETIQVKYTVKEKKVFINGQTIMMKIVSDIIDDISLNNKANTYDEVPMEY